MCNKIGIMGGTFDPIHFGHLHAAEEARIALGLSEVIFLPSGYPPHKTWKITPAEDRYNMTLLAVADSPFFSVSSLEIENQGFSYTFETLRKLKNSTKYKDAELYFITGLDAVLDIMNWREPAEIIKLCKIVAVNRLGYSGKEIEKLPADIQDAIISVEIPLLAISSTELRNRVAQGQSIRYLVPKEVNDYIVKRSLYVLEKE